MPKHQAPRGDPADRGRGVPRVGESPVSFECRLTQIIQLKTVGGVAVQTWLTLGRVVGVHIADSLLKGAVYDTAAARAIFRGGGAGDYFEIAADHLFRMTRPRQGQFQVERRKEHSRSFTTANSIVDRNVAGNAIARNLD